MSIQDIVSANEKNRSAFEQSVRQISCPICSTFSANPGNFAVEFKPQLAPNSTISDAVKNAFSDIYPTTKNAYLEATNTPLKITGKHVAVLFSGGPAAGGHNVLVGIQKALGSTNTLFGVRKGPKGLIEGDLFKIGPELATVQNMGGFDFLGTDRTKIKSEDQFLAVEKTVIEFELDAIIIVGGDDSNTNAAVLAQRLFGKCAVIGVPKTIDGDLQVGHLLPISFGFDTATKIYSELVGNILQDTASSLKYWHFVKLMGRSASQVTLEVALQTKPAVALISEEVAAKKQSLDDIVTHIASVISERAKNGIHHGVVIIPEGLIEFIPNLNIDALPQSIRDQLNADRDSHGNLQVSLIETEKLLGMLVAEKVKVATQYHFFGYEGRCGTPSLFDATFCLNLGLAAGSLALAGHTGHMVSVTDLDKGGKAIAIPLLNLITAEVRHGSETFVIEKALVDLNSPAFKYVESRRADWATQDCFASPGPRQFWGPVAHTLPLTVALNQGYSDLNFKIG